MSFTDLFFKNIISRYSCGKCHYTNTQRPSDITLGDFWGWEKVNPEINKDDKGISLILCNTEKGKKLFDAIKDELNYFPVELKDCMQTRLEYPTPIGKERDEFEKDYIKYGFEYTYKKHCKLTPSLKKRIKNKIKKYAKSIFKKG